MFASKTLDDCKPLQVSAVPAHRPEHDLTVEVASLEITHAATPRSSQRRQFTGSGRNLQQSLPAAIVAAMRKMSDQFLAIRSGLTVPPTNERNVFGTPARSNTWRRFEGRSRMRGTNA